MQKLKNYPNYDYSTFDLVLNNESMLLLIYTIVKINHVSLNNSIVDILIYFSSSIVNW